MSLGRWLLIHSLSLFLAAMLLAVWFWRDELDLDRAWDQLRRVSDSMEMPLSGESGGNSASGQETVTAAAGSTPSGPAGQSARPQAKAGEPASMPLASSAAPGIPPRGAKVPPDSGSNGQSLLQAARKAFWSRDFDRSITLYQRLIDENPDNPDYSGELGNIYYNLNRFDRAADLFHRAGQLLVEQGDLARARQLLPALTSLDREKGRQLQQAIEQALSGGHEQN